MNRIIKIFVCSLLLYLCVVSPSFSADTEAQSKDSGAVKSASVFFPAPAFEFDSAIDGSDVVHDFVIMNKGTDILKVDKVKTG